MPERARGARGCGSGRDWARRGEKQVNVGPISGAAPAGARGRGGRKLAALALGVMLAVTACGGGGSESGTGSGDGKGKDSTAAQSKQSEAVVGIAPEDGAKSVETSGALKVNASKGELTEVVVKNPDGDRIDGEISGDGATWTPSTHLAAATKYTVHAVAKDSEGRTA